LSKRRSTVGPETEGAKRASSASPPTHEVDEQRELGNAVLQGRLETDELTSAETAAPRAALTLVDHALAALHSAPADADRIARRVALLERSLLPERDALVDRLHASETARTVVDAALDRWFGAHDAETRWRVDAELLGARHALVGEIGPDPDGARQRSDVAGVVGPAALDALEAAAPPAVVGLCQTLALAVVLDEDEEEEEFLFDLPELS